MMAANIAREDLGDLEVPPAAQDHAVLKAKMVVLAPEVPRAIAEKTAAPDHVVPREKTAVPDHVVLRESAAHAGPKEIVAIAEKMERMVALAPEVPRERMAVPDHVVLREKTAVPDQEVPKAEMVVLDHVVLRENAARAVLREIVAIVEKMESRGLGVLPVAPVPGDRVGPREIAAIAEKMESRDLGVPGDRVALAVRMAVPPTPLTLYARCLTSWEKPAENAMIVQNRIPAASSRCC